MSGKSLSKEIAEEMRIWIEEVWQLERNWRGPNGERNVYRAPIGINLWKAKEQALHPALAESLERLRGKFEQADLGVGSADLYFHPLDWLHRDEKYPGRYPDHYERAMFNVLETVLVLHPPKDLLERIEARVNTILGHPYEESETGRRSLPPKNHFPPDLEDCTRLFGNLQPSEATLRYAERFLRGEFNVDVITDAQTVQYEKAYRVGYWSKPIFRFMEYIHLHKGLEYELFREALIETSRSLRRPVTASSVDGLSRILSDWRTTDSEQPKRGRAIDYAKSFLEISEVYMTRFAQEFSENLTDENYIYLRSIMNLQGGHWLIRAAEVHRDFKLKKLVVDLHGNHWYVHRPGIDALVIHLAKSKDVVPEDPAKQKSFVELLKTFPKPTLKYLVPVSEDARSLILQALGWEKTQPLIDFMLELGSRKFKGSFTTGTTDSPNSSDPSSGAIDLRLFREVTELAGGELVQEIFTLFHDARVNLLSTILILQAALGEGTQKIEKELKHRNQRALKSYALLPLRRGKQEALERYLFIQQFKKESGKFGPERQANERGAVQTALHNLAQVAGYPDVMRMEWDMESHLSTEVIPIGKKWEIEHYEVTLQLKGADPDLVILREGKILKSLPKAVRQNDRYEEIHNNVDEVRAQARRFRAFFEDMMTLGKVFSRDDLELLNRMPVPTFMLSRLILQTSDGELGLYVPDELAVEALDGRRKSIREAAIIAHPCHLFEAGQLGDWQRIVVNRHIIQPFKQAFRELYTITPAEVATALYSNRFAGFVVDGSRAVRLFQSRDWEIDDNVTPYKAYSELGFQARFEFPDVSHYWSNAASATSDRIMFRRYPINQREYRDRLEEALIPLVKIPPTIFSEVMRDADLVVSVALVGDRELLSHEVIKSRVDLVQALIQELNLEGITFEDHFAYVQGKLAKYRVHMGSAVIHVEPGSYLCIVPEGWGKDHKDIFLPFSDAGDRKTSEVISKIFLLRNDDKIRDESILSQIKRHDR